MLEASPTWLLKQIPYGQNAKPTKELYCLSRQHPVFRHRIVHVQSKYPNPLTSSMIVLNRYAFDIPRQLQVFRNMPLPPDRQPHANVWVAIMPSDFARYPDKKYSEPAGV
jgi:hypothetical protein